MKKSKRPNVLDVLVRKREVLAVIAAFQKSQRALEERIELLERIAQEAEESAMLANPISTTQMACNIALRNAQTTVDTAETTLTMGAPCK